MGILYLISTIILLILFVLIKKSEKEINIISFICISIVTLFCYNTFICYILTFFTIPIKLWLLALINFFIAFVLWFKIHITKKVQKYIFNKLDVLYISLICLVVLIISYINFGLPFNIKYETSDPAVHYLTAVKFAESDALLPGAENDQVYGMFSTRKTVSYVNSGLLMKCLCKNLEPIECYNIFVIFGILILFLTGTTLYGAFANFALNKEQRLYAFIVSTICILGYPLNSLLFGFEYLSMSLLIICAILDLIYYYEKEVLNRKIFIILMALLNFGLFSSYYMFVPFVYPSLGIYFYIKNYQKTNRILSIDIIKIWIITLIVPFLLGFIYHMMPKIYAVFINKSFDYTFFDFGITILVGMLGYYGIKIYIKKIKQKLNKISLLLTIVVTIFVFALIILCNNDFAKYFNENIEKLFYFPKRLLTERFNDNGYAYINFYSNILLLLPLPIYLIIKMGLKKRLKDNIFVIILLYCTLIFIFILYIGCINKVVSYYYLSKNYYALWIILMYFNYKALISLSENGRYFPKLFIISYLILMIVSVAFSDVRLIDGTTRNNAETIYSVMEIFEVNKTILIKEREQLNQDEIDILMYARKNLDYDTKIEVVTEGIPYYWSYVMLRYVNWEPILKTESYGQYRLNLKAYYVKNKINKVDYMIYFYRSKNYNMLKDRMFNNAKIIYENEAGGILKYNT